MIQDNPIPRSAFWGSERSIQLGDSSPLLKRRRVPSNSLEPINSSISPSSINRATHYDPRAMPIFPCRFENHSSTNGAKIR